MLKENHFAKVIFVSHPWASEDGYEVFVRKADQNRKKYLLLGTGGGLWGEQTIAHHKNIVRVVGLVPAPPDVRKWEQRARQAFFLQEKKDVEVYCKNLARVLRQETGAGQLTPYHHTLPAWQQYTSAIEQVIRKSRVTNAQWQHFYMVRTLFRRGIIIPTEQKLSRKVRRKLKRKEILRNGKAGRLLYYAIAPTDALEEGEAVKSPPVYEYATGRMKAPKIKKTGFGRPPIKKKVKSLRKRKKSVISQT